MTKAAHLVCFRIGQENFGVDIFSVREIVKAQAITPVPGTAEHVLGIINLRGKIISVVDLAQRLGLGAAAVDRQSRIFVVDLDGVTVGFLVDAATEVLKLAGESIEPAPEELKGAIRDHYLQGVGKLENGLVIILDLRNLFLEGEVASIDAVAAESGGATRASAANMIAPISENEFRLFRDYIHQECGLYFADNRRAFLSSLIGKRLLARSIGSFFRYYSYLKQGGTEEEEELLQLLDVLTINETSFFRNLPQFEILEQRVLPELLERKAEASERSLRIWSAGCSTGEEPYSIAISVLEALPTRPEWQVKIYASDLSLSVLEKAANGRYAKARLQDLTPARLRRFFEPDDGGHRVVEALKRLVIFDFHNLKHENGLGDLDIVFCRNVLIYFDPQEQKKVINKLARALRPGGYLFLGHSESVQGMGPELEFVHHQRGTAYRKREIA